MRTNAMVSDECEHCAQLRRLVLTSILDEGDLAHQLARAVRSGDACLRELLRSKIQAAEAAREQAQRSLRSHRRTHNKEAA